MRSSVSLSRRGKFVFWVAALVVSLLLVETAVRITEGLPRKPGPKSVEDLAIYSDRGMARKLRREDAGNEGKILLPFSGWAHRPYDGAYVHVAANSERKNWNPPEDSRRVFRIFVFGGSTVWGTGVRDEGTIPSETSKILNDGRSPEVRYVVRNLGETAYSFVQNATRLLMLLQEGERPDLVVFYGGFNETFFAYQTGAGGIEGSERYIANFYRDRIYQSAPRQALNQLRERFGPLCHGCRAATAGLRRIWPGFLIAPGAMEEGSRMSEDDLDRLAERTAGDFQNKFVDYLDGLGEGFRFRSVFFWQPNLYVEPKQIGEENQVERFYPHRDDAKAASLFRKTYSRIHTDESRNFFDLSDALHERTRECYLDEVHLSEECNRTVSRRIVRTLNSRYLR